MLFDTHQRKQQRTPKLRQKQHHVAFKPTVSVVLVPHISLWSKEEIESTWYSTEESRRRIEFLRTAVYLMTNNGDKRRSQNKNEDHFCTDGLVSQHDSLHQQEVIDAEVDAVLTEQQYQYDDGVQDPNQLADICVSFTRFSQWQAQQRGVRHAAEVKLLWDNDGEKYKTRLVAATTAE